MAEVVRFRGESAGAKDRSGSSEITGVVMGSLQAAGRLT